MRISSWLLCLIFLLVILFQSCGEKEPALHSTEYEHASFKLADPGLEITLIASEPDINGPVDMSWGPDGSLYVLEMTGYPITPGKGAVKKLTDKDGDGFYTLEAVFADNLNFPAGLMYYREGILVADAPDILFLKDNDGDGKAEIREVLITGFGEDNQQYRANSLQWGLDNWIYGAGGRGGGELSYEGDSVQVSIYGRDFRINPGSRKIEPISGMSQFGLTHDNSGNRFISYNHRFARQVMLQEEQLLRNPSLTTMAIFDTSRSEHDRRVWTLLTESLRFNQDPIGYFTSLSGLTFYGGNLLGPDYEGSMFAGESVQAAVIRRKMVAEGPAFLAYNTEEEAEFLSATDDWFHPVNFSNGPDGAFYVVDFYRKFVEHPEWAHDDKSEGIDWNIGEDHGRIWRIARKSDPIDTARMNPDMEKLDLESLVAQLGDEAVWRRRMAQQVLVDGKMTAAKEALEAMLGSENRYGRIHSLWTLDGLGLLNEAHIRQALTHTDNELVLQGIKLFEKYRPQSSDLHQLIYQLAAAKNSTSRYYAILALGNSPADEVQKILKETALAYTDKWTRLALLSSLSGRTADFNKHIFNATSADSFCHSTDFDFFRAIGALSVYEKTELDPTIQNWIVKGDMDNCPSWAFLLGYMNTAEAIGKNVGQLPPTVFSTALEHVESSDNSALVSNCIELLRYSESEADWQKLLDIVSRSDDELVRRIGIRALSHLNSRAISESLFAMLDDMDVETRKALISNAQNSMTFSLVLLDGIERNQLELTEIPEELRYALLNHSDDGLRQRSNELLGASVSSDRDSIIRQYVAALPALDPDPNNGATVFRTNCTVCHSMLGEGGILGPDLTNIGNRSDEILLTSILDPGRMVSYELKLHVVTTESGRTYSGTLAAETETSITIKQPDGEEHTVLRTNIRDHKELNQSIMPEGYERLIDEQSMADLISFLKKPG